MFLFFMSREAPSVRNFADLPKERDPFVLVLIDGDGMIFNDDLIRLGDTGGRQAAGALWNALSEYVHATLEVPSDIKIVTRIYANLKGLGDTCAKAGITSTSDVIEDFARGFTGSKQLFDFVDVGMGKDRADDKLSGDIYSSVFAENVLRHFRNIQVASPRLSLSPHILWLFPR